MKTSPRTSPRDVRRRAIVAPFFSTSTRCAERSTVTPASRNMVSNTCSATCGSKKKARCTRFEACAACLLDGAGAPEELTGQAADHLRSSLPGVGVRQAAAHHAADPPTGLEQHHSAPRARGRHGRGHTRGRRTEHDDVRARGDRLGGIRLRAVLHARHHERRADDDSPGRSRSVSKHQDERSIARR